MIICSCDEIWKSEGFVARIFYGSSSVYIYEVLGNKKLRVGRENQKIHPRLAIYRIIHFDDFDKRGWSKAIPKDRLIPYKYNNRGKKL